MLENNIIKSIEPQLNTIKEELNFKLIEFIHDNAVLDSPFLTVNFKKAGAVLKKYVQLVKELLEKLTEEQPLSLVNEFDSNNELLIPGWDTKLACDLFIKQTKPKKELIVESNGNLVVDLDTRLNQELLEAGIAREIIRQCQVLRKEINLDVEQRIWVSFKHSDDTINKVLYVFNQRIKNDILANDVLNQLRPPKISKEIIVNDKKIEISISINE